MKRFCKDLKEHATEIINYEKKEMKPLTDEKINPISIKKFVTYAIKDLVLMITITIIIKSKIIVTILENIDELLIIFAI